MSRPGSGCTDCGWLCSEGETHFCGHPSLHADPGASGAVTRFVKAAEGPGSPQVVPPWCPLLLEVPPKPAPYEHLRRAEEDWAAEHTEVERLERKLFALERIHSATAGALARALRGVSQADVLAR